MASERGREMRSLVKCARLIALAQGAPIDENSKAANNRRLSGNRAEPCIRAAGINGTLPNAILIKRS